MEQLARVLDLKSFITLVRNDLHKAIAKKTGMDVAIIHKPIGHLQYLTVFLTEILVYA